MTRKEEARLRRAANEAARVYRPVQIEARLAAPLCGDPPQLDALLENMMGPFHPSGLPESRVDRALPAPPLAVIPIPVLRREVNGWPVACCSAPILAAEDAETVEHIGKRIDPSLAGLLAPGAARKINTTNSWTKSYRLPLRIRRVEAIVWFAVADRPTILRLLRRVPALGKKRSVGYGAVASWDVTWADEDWSWFGPCESGPLLMRCLPDGDGLPVNLVGGRRDFGACCPPYWHQERYTEVVVPC